MNSIGGYFELEINDLGSLYHDNAIALNSGRNGFEHILNSKQYLHVFIPYYTCEVILDSLIKNKISYTYYHINKNFLPIISQFKDNSALLYTNYFGLMHNNVLELSKKYSNLIVDNAQAFYDNPIKGISSFYSPRKFFGLPDGGFVYFADEASISNYSVDTSFDKFDHLLSSVEFGTESGYDKFKKNEEYLKGHPIKIMSKLTNKLMRGIDYENIREKRMMNFNYLHNKLKSKNHLTSLIDNAKIIGPMVYPFLHEGNEQLRKKLISQKIFIAQYWPNVLSLVNKDSFEYDLTQNLIHLPIDQRVEKIDIQKIAQTVINSL
ncbi:MAG: hypothetical protein M3Q58_04425 [Bacteroidota bacterium]|nr:hypothetical protein [Bacteroidota bacterium]